MILSDLDAFNRWFKMAFHTLDSAINDFNSGFFNWCCFKCHQAIEFTLKALLHGIGKETHGHSLTRLVRKISQFLEVELSNEVIQACPTLNKYYVPTRYVNV